MTEEQLDALRPSAFAIAYRMLGRVSEAEDVVQEGMLRLHRARAGGERIESPRAYLSTVVSRLALDHLRSAGVHSLEKRDTIRFNSVEPWPGNWLAAEARYADGEAREKRAGILIGPEFGTLTRSQMFLSFSLHHHEIVIVEVDFEHTINPWDVHELPAIVEAGKKAIEAHKTTILSAITGFTKSKPPVEPQPAADAIDVSKEKVKSPTDAGSGVRRTTLLDKSALAEDVPTSGRPD